MGICIIYTYIHIYIYTHTHTQSFIGFIFVFMQDGNSSIMSKRHNEDGRF